MGLLSALGLSVPKSLAGSSGKLESNLAPPPVRQVEPGTANGTDPDDAALLEQMQIVDDYLGSVGDEKLKARLVAESEKLGALHAKVRQLADPKKRSAGLRAAMPAVKALLAKASQLAMKEQEKRFVADARAEVEAMVSQVTALVLGGINADEPRNRINAELTKLRAAVAKAAQVSDPKAAMKGWNAVKPAARDLLGKAEAAAGAVNWADGQLKPLIAPTRAAVDALAAAGPRTTLGGLLAAIESDIARFQAASDVASLQSVVAPRLQKLHRLATGLAEASTKADGDLARAAQLIAAFDEARSADIRATLKTLQDHKLSAWPAGSTLEEIDAALGTFAASVARLNTDAAALKVKLESLRQIDELRKRVELLKPRTDKANERPVPAFIDQEQKKVLARLAAVTAALDAEDLKKAEVAYSGLGAALDNLEACKKVWAKFKQDLAAARNGEIRTALALKLEPAALAASRTKAIDKGEADLLAFAGSGQVKRATDGIAAWIVGAKAWAGAKEAYDNMRGNKPSAAAMAKLAKVPGGGRVLDALVADLPDDIPQVVLTEAIQARYGIKVKQYDHRDNKGSGGPRKAANPKTPDKAVKGLYQVLGKVPLKDTAKVKRIDRYTEESGGAAYGGGEIDLYCGRPGDGNVQEFNKPGEVVPAGEKVDKNCEPVNTGQKVGYFDFATLHEVGHAVDDKKNIMGGGRNADAGWEAPSTSAIAAVAAARFKYDAGYIESMLKSKTSAAPARKPAPPSGVAAPAWDLARRQAEDWVKSIRVDAGLWWHAADSKRLAIHGRVYQESYAGQWVSYRLSARAQGVTGYQFRSPAEWFAELYAAYFMKKMNPKHPAAAWLDKLKAEAN